VHIDMFLISARSWKPLFKIDAPKLLTTLKRPADIDYTHPQFLTPNPHVTLLHYIVEVWSHPNSLSVFGCESPQKSPRHSVLKQPASAPQLLSVSVPQCRCCYCCCSGNRTGSNGSFHMRIGRQRVARVRWFNSVKKSAASWNAPCEGCQRGGCSELHA